MIRRLLAPLLLLAPPASAEGTPGAFDYWVLALSWSPTWCALEGEERGSPQCEPGADGGEGFAWVLHGLWPQYEEGWPRDCPTPRRDPSRRETAAMADIMGTAGLAWHAWRAHGTCSGLDPADYFALSRLLFERAALPPALERLSEPVELPAAVVEEAFLREDPALPADGVTVTCREGRIEEVRLCLTRDLDPRPCGADARADCRLEDARLDPAP